MADKISVFALGGLDEHGKNLTVVEINEDIFILDCGLKFPNKLTPGIDFLIPNTSYIEENKNRVKAYIITHAHDEQLGSLPFFYKIAPAPVYCTTITKFVIERRSIFAKRRLDYNFCLIEPSSVHNISGHEVHFFQTIHNSVDSFGVAIWTDQGYIVYTSEFIVNHDTRSSHFKFDLPALGKVSEKQTLLLMAESLGAHQDGYVSPHHKMGTILKSYFSDAPGRIFVAAFWPNSYNLVEIINLAVQHHKKIVFYDMVAKEIVLGCAKLGIVNLTNNNLIDYQDVLRYPDKDLVFLMVGHGESIFERVKDLCHKRNEDKRIYLTEQDTFLLCTPPSDNLEDDFTETVDELFKTGAKVVYVKKKDVAAMHARSDDLKLVLSLLKPKYYLPVNGSYSQLIANAKLAVSMDIGLNYSNVFVLDNGMRITFDGMNRPIARLDQSIDTTEKIIDGLGVGDVSSGILDERNKLAYGGVVVISSTISKKTRQIIAKPDCQMRGFVFVKDAEPILRQITNIYVNEISDALNKSGPFDNAKVCEDIKDKVTKSIRHNLKRDPMIVPVIIEID